MDEQQAVIEGALDRAPINVKLPKWIKQLAASIGELTGEDIGEVIERHIGESITREYRERTAAVVSSLGDAGV